MPHQSEQRSTLKCSASLRSFFLTHFLLFAQTTDRATKTLADIGGHRLRMSWLAVDSHTADGSHTCGTLFAIRELKRQLVRVAHCHVHENAGLRYEIRTGTITSRCLRLFIYRPAAISEQDSQGATDSQFRQ